MKIEKETIRLYKDGKCSCHCGNVCPLGRAGSMLRCSEQELNDAGYFFKNGVFEFNFDRETYKPVK